jgi:hypothetical protein
MFEFETPVEPVGEPAAEPVEPVEPAWSGPSQDEWQQTQNLIAYVAQALQPQEEPQQVDPFAEDFQQRLDQYLEQRLAPIQQVQQQAQYAQAEEQAMEILSGYAKDDPYLLPDSQEKARALANQYLPQTQQRYGYGPQAAEAALQMAHTAVRQWENQVGEAYHQRQLEQLGQLGQVRREPAAAGMNGQSSQMIAASGPGDERSVLNKYFNGR